MALSIIDSHIHFWDPKKLRYSWLKGVPTINHAHYPKDVVSAAAESDLQGIVFVEAGCDDSDGVAEADWVRSLAQEEPRIQGIVAFAPMEHGPAVRPLLEALAKNPLVKGVRRVTQSEALGFGVQPDFVSAVQILPEFDFSFDICIKHHQLPDAIRLVEQCPQVSFVLDHFGKPDVAQGLQDPWREQLARLAEFPNVVCKISGLATEADHQNWTRAQLKPYIQHAVAVFGEDRVLYGGDWPVSTLAIEWQEWVDTIVWALPELSQEAQHKLFVENAKRVYRLSA